MVLLVFFKKNILTPIYRIFKSRIAGSGSIILSAVGYLFDGIGILFIGAMLGLFTKSGIISMDFLLQSFLLVIFLLSLFFHSIRSFDITPFLTLPISKTVLTDFFLQKELYSKWIFLIYPFILPVLIINNSLSFQLFQWIYLALMIYFVGLAINLLSNFIRILIDSAKIKFSLSIGFIVLIYIYLSASRDFLVLPIFEIFLNQPYISGVTIVILCILILKINKICLKKSISLLFENQVTHKFFFTTNSSFGFRQNNYLLTLHIKEMVRCKAFQTQIMTMLSLLFSGILLYFLPSFRLIGICMFIGAYSLSMVEYTIIKDSVYFDSLQTKPISMQHLLVSDYILSLVFTSFSFILTLAWTFFKDTDDLLALVTIFLFTIGPSTFILFQIVINSSKRFDPFEITRGSNKRVMSDLQKFKRFLAGFSLFIPVLVISLFTDIVSIFLIIISTLCIIIHPLWIQSVCRRFERRRYDAMEGFRIQQ